VPLEVDIISLARLTLGNRFSRKLLKGLTAEDKHGYRTRLEHHLAAFSGDGEPPHHPLTCLLDYYIFQAFLESAIRLLRSSRDEFKAGVRDPAVRRGVSVVMKSLATYGVTVPQRLTAPFLVVWNFTNACNLRCKHCYQAASKPLPTELTLEEKLDVMRQIDEMDIPVVALSGGEPTIHPHFLRVVEEGAERGIYMAVATNGIRLADKEFAEEALKPGQDTSSEASLIPFTGR